MSNKDRRGARKDRNKKLGTRIPELGYYLIVTDTKETEKNYFHGLRDSIPAELRDRLVIKVEMVKTVAYLIEKAVNLLEKESQYRVPWIVFDRDQVMDFDKIVELAEEKGLNAGWSNPCIEIWFYAYFGEMPVIAESKTCCVRFAEKYEAVTGQKYQKTNQNIYNKLVQNGDEKKAIEIAERCYRKCEEDGKKKPSEICPACTVYQLVEEIREKIVKNE